MKVNIITTSGLKTVFNNADKIECDEKNLYIYVGPFGIKLYQTIIPLKDIKEYTVEFDN